MTPELYRRMAEVERKHWWYLGRNAIICQFLETLGLPANARILDVGCGTGALTEMLTQFGSVVACDPSDLAISHIAARPQLLPVSPAQLSGNAEWIGQFDLIGFFDVIEHAPSDVALLRQYRPFLKEDGVMVATVPAWNLFWGDHDVAAGHYRRYRLSTLVPAFEAIGFQLHRSTYFNLVLAPLILLARISKRATSASSECGDLSLPPPLLNSLLKQVFFLERHLLRVLRLPFGVSLLGVFRRVAAAP